MDQEKIWQYHQDPEKSTSFDSNRGRLRYVATKILAHESVLNIGVGNAYLEEQLIQRGISVSTLDPDEEAIARLRKYFKVSENNEKVGYSQEIPFGDQTFDVVVMSEVLEHLNNDILARTLEEVSRVLRDGGRFLGTVPANENLASSETICPACGNQFHRWGHEQSFNKKRLEKILGSVFPDVWVRAVFLAAPDELNLKGKIVWFLKKIQNLLGLQSSNDRFFFECRSHKEVGIA